MSESEQGADTQGADTQGADSQDADTQERELRKLETEAARQASKLKDHSNELAADIDEVSKDWQRKREDSSVPGALPPDEDDANDS
jgi:molecular chaperone GrpE (heat shock protein)